MYKQQYYDALDPRPVWPMEPYRVEAIYGTMRRTIRNASESDKSHLRQELIQVATGFDKDCSDVTLSQDDFDSWHNAQINRLLNIPFSWTDAGKKNRFFITLGLAQKFTNLMLKDWWCVSDQADILDYSVLHAPFDNIVWDKLWKLIKVNFTSLKQGGYYVYLSKEDYYKYQKILTSPKLMRAMGITQPLVRLEVEQLLWGS